jgi:hypothetical protein
MAGKHIHLHLHKTADAGTSEGARKAAQTRKTHGGGATSTYPHSQATHAARAEHLEKQAARFRGNGQHGVASQYQQVANMHKKASKMALSTPAGRKYSEHVHAMARANRMD